MAERVRTFEDLHVNQNNALEQLKLLVNDPEWNKGLESLYWQGVFL